MILEQSRWERFAQLVADGVSGTAAYRTCYRARGASAEASASRLLRNVKVRRRISELQTASEKAVVMSLHEKRVWLARVVRAKIGMLDLAKDGDLIQEVAYREGNGRKIIRIKFPSKLECIMLDARLAGELRGNAVVQVHAPMNGHVITEERRKELMERRRQAILRLEGSRCQ